MSFIKIDQLNIPISEIDSDTYTKLRKYFEPMEIDEDRKETRVKTAYEFYDVMMFFFALVNTSIAYNQLERTYLASQLKSRWLDATNKCVETDDYLMDYVNRIVEDIVVVTVSHLEPLLTQDDKNLDDNHWVSQDRALAISENASNVLINYGELMEAYESGYTHKTWVTMRDSHVRGSHKRVDGKTIRLDEYFMVGEDLMMCPMDADASFEETANCRCSLNYEKRGDNESLDFE